MKALTLCEPYASAVIHGGKDVENRSWPTSYRGRFLIHAGMSKSWFDCLPSVRELWLDCPSRDALLCRRGLILGSANLVACVRFDEDSSASLGRWAFGPWCFVFEDVRRIVKPFHWKGAMGFWDLPDDQLRKLAPEAFTD